MKLILGLSARGVVEIVLCILSFEYLGMWGLLVLVAWATIFPPDIPWWRRV